MKKTLLALLSLAGAVTAADKVEFDFKASDLTEVGLSSITLTDTLTQYTATITAASTAASNYTLVGGDWGTGGTGAFYDYIAANSKEGAADLTLTLGGLEAGCTYDVCIVTGVPFEGQGSWNSMSTTNEYTSTSLPFGEQNVQVRAITTYDVKSVIADANGVITFKVDNTGGAHTASFNYASVKQVIPEPTTATLSLLALAGLAARRRRR